MSNYDYAELREKAISPNSTTADRLNLFHWMEDHDIGDWNGECFDIDDGLSLYPVFKEVVDEDGDVLEIEVIDAEIR